MDLPASYYGELDKRNPVIVSFKRDIRSFTTLMKEVVSADSQNNSSYAKGILLLMEIRRKYTHRLPSSLYWEHMLRVADFLFGLKLYQLAAWHGYGLHLQELTPVTITDITDIDHFMASFFPEGFDKDQPSLTLKIRSMQACALCIFEEEKQRPALTSRGLHKLLHVLNFIRIMMQAFQKNPDFHPHIYEASALIYNICRYLIAMKCCAQALEYLLWASLSLELPFHLTGAKYLSLSVTLYCAVCHCYYDNQAELQAEGFARRALGKINEIAKLEERRNVPACREAQRAFKEASVKLGTMIFRRSVFESRKRRPKAMLRKTLKDVPNGQWPCSPTQHLLSKLLQCSAAHFWGILEALWESTADSLQIRMPKDPQRQEVVLELLSAGISIISGAASCGNQIHDAPHLSVVTLTSTSDLLESAITGENRVPILSAVKFIKLLFQYQQQEAFTVLSREMQQILSDNEGHAFRKAERELTILSMLSTQKSLSVNVDNNQGQMSSFALSDDIAALVDTLHVFVCASPSEEQPDKALVVKIVLFLWSKMKMQQTSESAQKPQKGEIPNKLVSCLSKLCDVAFACDTVTVDCVTMTQMIYSLRILLENELLSLDQTGKTSEIHHQREKRCDITQLQMICDVVERGLEALEKHVASLPPPQDPSALSDTAFMQKFRDVGAPQRPSCCSSTSLKEENREEEKIMDSEGDRESKVDDENEDPAYMEAKSLHLELHIIYTKVSLKLLQLNKVTELQLLDRIKNNKVSKAFFLVQKSLLLYEEQQGDNTKTTNLLQEACILMEKAGMEEKRMLIQINHQHKRLKEDENVPPPPILLSRTDHSLTFIPGPYIAEGSVYWYRLCGRVAEGHNRKVSQADCSLPGTGNMVPAVSGKCVLKAEGLERNQKFVFAVAAYNQEMKLMGKTIGAPTLPLLASMSVHLLYTWAELAQVAFQTKNYTTAKRACGELWGHFTEPVCGCDSREDRLATTGLSHRTLQCASVQLSKMFLASIFIETEINILQGSLFWDSFSERGPFIWEKEARLAECERMLVAIDLALYLNDGSAAVQATICCYGLLAPIISHQIPCPSVAQMLKKCLVVLEENSGYLKQIWAAKTSESLFHMIACITYYLSKTLHLLGGHQIASSLLEAGSRLLKEVYEAQCVAGESTAFRREPKTILHLRILREKNKGKTTSDAGHTALTDNFMPLTHSEDPSTLYDLISHCRLSDAFQILKKLKRKPHFAELAAVLLQRGIEEGRPDLVLKWGEPVLKLLSGCNEPRGRSAEHVGRKHEINHRSDGGASDNKEISQNKSSSPHDSRKRPGKKLSRSTLQGLRTEREMPLERKLLDMMSYVVQRHKKKLQLRSVSSEESLWKSQLNYSMAQGHSALLHQELEKMHRGGQERSYTLFHPLSSSLAYSGVWLQRNSQEHPELVLNSSKLSPSGARNDAAAAHKEEGKHEADGLDGDATKGKDEHGENQSEAAEQEQKTQDVLLLEYLTKVALHLSRAAVFAHRGGHWTTLQYVCQTVWDQNFRIAIILQELAQLEAPTPFTVDQLKSIFTPVFVLATDLMMDMLKILGLWSLCDNDTMEKDLECSLHFSAALDDRTQVDLRWIRAFMLHTLERLHDSGKWESLAHLALLFNSYTKERYASVVTPLLMNAQKRLLERIKSFGGPAVPQPHHIKTWKVTGKKVMCRTYAECQLLCDMNPESIHRNAVSSKEVLELKDSEMKLAMSLVCVPLDVEDTMRCYEEALEKKPQCLQVFQHSRFLLRRLLADTRTCLATAFSEQTQSRGPRSSVSFSDLAPMVKGTPNIQQSNRTEEDLSPFNDIYNHPFDRDQLKTITAAYSSSIKYFMANGHDSLRVQGLHEMGDLHFYNGKLQAAHTCWRKAVDCALQGSSVVENWDGVPNGSESSRETLKQAGIWGCLQAAILTAKLAQYTVTSDISQRSKCCLLSAHLFKSVLSCSMAQPLSDLQYASNVFGERLFPGVDLFSEPYRADVGSTVASLNFVCNWLLTAGYHSTVLPILAFYLYVVGTVCRNVEHTVDARILKVQVLTHLHLFSDAVREAVELTLGSGVLLPHGHYITKAGLLRMFYSDKCLLDNLEALQELLRCDFSPEVCTLYGPTLCVRVHLVRAQLLLALADSTCCCSVPDSNEEGTASKCGSGTPNLKEMDEQNVGLSSEKKGSIAVTQSEKEEKPTQCVKSLLLDGATSLLDSVLQQLHSDLCGEMEKLELTLESSLLKSRLLLQQGKPALSVEETKSSLLLLQTSPLILSRSTHVSQNQSKNVSDKQSVTKEGRRLNEIQGDCPREVWAGERVGLPLWLRCRSALVSGLIACINSESAPSSENLIVEAAQALQHTIEECERFGDTHTQTQLMLKRAEMESKRKRSQDSLSILQEVVDLVSGRADSPPGSVITLARSVLLISELRREPSLALLQLTQSLLKNQLCAFGENMSSVDKNVCTSSHGPSNIYLPHFDLLNQTNRQIGHVPGQGDRSERPEST